MRIAENFVAATPKYFAMVGDFFRIETAGSDIDVDFFRGGQQLPENLRNAQAGYWAAPTGGFDQILITSSANQVIAVDVYRGRVGADRVAGSVSISGVPNVDVVDRAARLLGVVYGTLGAAAQVLIGGVNALAAYCYGTLGALAQVAIGSVNALWVTERGMAYASTFVTNANLAANTPQAVFLAANNTNGATIWVADFVSHNAGSSFGLSLLANATAPANVVDGNPLLGPDNATVDGTGGFNLGGALVRPVFVPAGLGVYWISTAAETQAHRRCLFTLH